MVFQFVLHFKNIDDFTGEAQAREVEFALDVFFGGEGGGDRQASVNFKDETFITGN